MTEHHGGVVALNGSPSDTSKTHAVASAAIDLVGGGTLIDLGALDGDALLGRRRHASVDDAIEAVVHAELLVVTTPIYRATYSGLLKVLFDQLPQDGLRGVVALLAATGGSPHHYLAIETGLRPLIASLSGTGAPDSLYLTSADFNENVLTDEARERLGSALEIARALVSAHATHHVAR